MILYQHIVSAVPIEISTEIEQPPTRIPLLHRRRLHDGISQFEREGAGHIRRLRERACFRLKMDAYFMLKLAACHCTQERLPQSRIEQRGTIDN